MRKFISVVAFLLIAIPSYAANWYVRPSGGSGSGTSWTAAWNDFDSINWGSVSAGDTIWVAGGSYGDLTPAKSGSSGNWINIRRARADSTDCTGAAGWSSGYDSTVVQTGATITINNYNYILVSGRTTADGGTHGWYINKIDAEEHGIYFPNGTTGSYITFEYMEIESANQYSWTGQGNGIEDRPLGTSGNHTFSHIKIHGWNTPFYILGPSYVTIEYCEIYNTKGDGDRHPNIMYIKHSEHGIIRYNVIHDNEAYGTGIAFSDGFEGWSSYDYWKIYGNIFYNNDDESGSVAIAIQAGDTTTVMLGFELYNNTFDDSSMRLSDATCGSGSAIRNNIWYNSGYVDCGTQSNNLDDASANIFVNRGDRDYHIVAATGSGYPRDAGTSLTSDGYINKDKDGNTRGSDGYWDIGAYEYGGGGGADITAPVLDNLSPSGTLSCTSNPRNVTISFTTSENAIARMATTDIFFADMTDDFTNTGGTSHSETKSLACGASYEYFVKARDPSLNVSLPGYISFTISSQAIAGPGGLRMTGVKWGE